MLSLVLTDGVTTATLHALAATFVLGDGWNFGGSENEEFTTDTLQLLIRGANVAAIQTVIRTIETLITQVRLRAVDQTGRQVWLRRQLDGETQVQSEVLDARLEVPNLPEQWNSRRINAILTVQRRNWWEPLTDTELEISAPNQSAGIGGKTIYNHWDGDTGHGFWFTISGAQVLGDQPSPFRIELTNTAGAGRVYSQIHIANNIRNDPANFVARVEGESASSGGSSEADANSSNGNRRTVTVNTSATLSWALNDAFVADTSGDFFWLLARVVSVVGGNVNVLPELRTASGVFVWQAHEPIQWGASANPYLGVLGTMPIPPGSWDVTWDDLVLRLVLSSASSVVVKIDFIAFFPVKGYRLITMFEETIANNETVVVDDMQGYAGTRNSGLLRPNVSPRDEPILLKPGETQRLYVLQDLASGCNIADTFSVKVFHKPRWRKV